MAALDFLADQLAKLDAEGLRRQLRRVSTRQSAVIHLDDRAVVNFASNNYLGLASHPALARAAAEAAERLGTGAGASRLIVGNLAEHDTLESELASFHEAPAALLFNTGYQANLGVISSLAGPDDLIVSDELNHASLIDGCRLSRARVAVFRHLDLDQAADLLAGPASRRFLVSESVFSMDGDHADVVSLAALATRFNAALVLDEAHAVGAVGPVGRGLAAAAGVVPDVLVGTFGKAFGSFGAYVVGTRVLCDWLISRARPFVFTTGLPATVVAASRAALAVVRSDEGEELRGALRSRIDLLSRALQELGVLTHHHARSPIFPVVLGAEERAMTASRQLLSAGYYAQGIRPPTVPRGTSRLRITAMAQHTDDHIAGLARALSGLELAARRPPDL